MNLVKMSMVAALLLGANAYAIENVEVKGDVKAYYYGTDAGNGVELFDKESASFSTALHLGVTADLADHVTSGVSITAVSTLGFENNLANGTISSAHDQQVAGGQIDDASWVGEAWIGFTGGKTTAKIGRQTLNTPFAFSETWGIDSNTFEAVALLNEDIDDTTLVAAYIGKSNGSAHDTSVGNNIYGNAGANIVSTDGKFNSFFNGVYVIGAINNSWEPLAVQGWYYDIQGVADAFWLQADLNMEGILAGLQYADINGRGLTDNDTVAGAMLGYEMKDIVTIKAAFTSVDNKGSLGSVANIATGSGGGAESKLYTEQWWNFGKVSVTGADSISLVGTTKVEGYDLLLGFYSSDVDASTNNLAGVENGTYDEVTIAANKSYGALDIGLGLAYDMYDLDVAGKTEETWVFITTGYNF